MRHWSLLHAVQWSFICSIFGSLCLNVGSAFAFSFVVSGWLIFDREVHGFWYSSWNFFSIRVIRECGGVVDISLFASFECYLKLSVVVLMILSKRDGDNVKNG